MTDEELIAMARLAQRDDRMATGALYGDLADRIEALLEQCEGLAQVVDYNWVKHQRVTAAEAKLAKAVEALERAKASIENGGGGGVVDVVWLDDPCPETLCDFIDATLAEIKGESHE